MRGRELPTGPAVGVLAAWGALMHLAYKREAARQRKVARGVKEDANNARPAGDSKIKTVAAAQSKGQGHGSAALDLRDRSRVLLARSRLVDHPAFAWLFENGSVWLIAAARLVVTNTRVAYDRHGGWAWKLARIWCGIMVTERLQLLLHYTLVHKVYSHLPYFHPTDNLDSVAGMRIEPGEAGTVTVDADADTNDKNDTAANGGIGIPRAHGGLRRILVEFVRTTAGSQFFLSLLVLSQLRSKVPCAAITWAHIPSFNSVHSHSQYHCHTR